MNRGLIKKTMAVILSMALTFGAVSVLPSGVVKDNAIVAHAADRSECSSIEVNGCVFYYTTPVNNGVTTITIEDCDINNVGGVVNIPAYIRHNGTEYPVTTLGWSFLFQNNKIKELILPETMVTITSNVLWQSTVEKVTLPDNIESVGYGFCYGCNNLKRENVKYNGSKIKEMGPLVFAGCPNMPDENGIVTLQNWLVRYEPKNEPSQVKIADLGSNGVKIDSIAESAINAKTLKSVDLQGINFIGKNCFADHPLLNTVLNYGSDVTTMEGAFENTPWLLNNKENSNGFIATFDNCSVYCEFTKRTGKETLMVCKAVKFEDTLNIPSTINVDGVDYTVTDIGDGFLSSNYNIKNVTFPSTVTKIGNRVLQSSGIRNLTIPNGLEELGTDFCASCTYISPENVKYEGTKIKYVDPSVFKSCYSMKNEQGAVSLGNWLLSYSPAKETTSVKIADLGNNGNKIDSIPDKAITGSNSTMTSMDLSGVKYIGSNNFSKWTGLQTITNGSSVEWVGEGSFSDTPWFSTEKAKGLVKLGKAILYYSSIDDTIDLTKGVLAGVTCIHKGAFADCTNAVNLICTSDSKFAANCFYVANSGNSTSPVDPLPAKATYKIKNITLDGKELKFSKSDPEFPKWVSENYDALEGSEWMKINAEAKMKAVFDQMGMTYYGPANNKIGTLSATKEFYNALKAHEYISAFDPDSDSEYNSAVHAFLNGGKLNDAEYSYLLHYMLECAGVDYRSLVSPDHTWNTMKIGGEWFEADGGLDAQNGHGYGWFALSSARVDALDAANGSTYHQHSYTSDTWHEFNSDYISMDRPEAKKVLGDLNGDGKRDQKDVDKLWDHINGKGSVDKKLGDINFDGTINIKDAVLLDAFVNNTSVDAKKYSADGLAPGFNVAFVNGNNYSSINYQMTDKDGYIVLPAKPMFDVPKGKAFDGWNLGKAGAKVKITDPYTVIQPKWKSTGLLGDVDGNNIIDIGDVSMLINHINGVKALDDEAMLRADVNKSKTVDISDASTIINHINGVKALNGYV